MKNDIFRKTLVLGAIGISLTSLASSSLNAADVQVLFVGDQGHHRPADRAAQLIPVMRERGIKITYTEDLSDLNATTLAAYDGLIVYANIDRIEPEQERALLEFVASGKGFLPIHCASFCFRNSPKYVQLVGAQFKRHGTGVFRTSITESGHPVMAGFGGFESWDETYVHELHNEKDRTVLSYRVDGEGREPWTWIRTHGNGRVFYTAWGHDHRTWGHPGFQNLIERGIRWAVGKDPADVPDFVDETPFPLPDMTPQRTDVEPFRYTEAKVPFYPPSERWGIMGEPITKIQLPLDADESAKHFVTPTDFEVQLFAADPDILKPICMNWDERGRLWIAETVDYPNDLQPEGEGRDQIKICEDTDGDGRADKFTVFADKLSIPTSITFSRGGAIVHQAPHTLFLKDNDGDDRADVREILFTGWNTRDTHAGPSNLAYGLDNWIWGMQGYAGFQAEIGGESHRFNQGFYRFKPDGSKLEFVRSTNNNTWGIGFSEDGLVFGSTANRNPSIYMPIPNRYYEKVRGWSASQLVSIADNHLFDPITEKVRQVDHHGGYTAGAGHALYTARAYPQQYWNRAAFVCGPTGHLIGTFVLNRKGADVASTSPFNLLASDDEWSAPIMAEVGPDGSVWVIDWYNYIVQHNPTPAGYKTGKGNAYESDLRDKRHGRVYRVVAKNSAAYEPITLAGASREQLVATLGNTNMLWRKHAQRLLVERGELDVVPALLELVRDDSMDEIGLNVGAIHALWTLHGLGALQTSDEAVSVVRGALQHKSAGVRRNAIAVLPRNEEAISGLLASGVQDDPDAQVRLAAFLAIADSAPNEQAGKAVATSLRTNASDRWLVDALTSAGATHDRYFLAAMTAHRNIPPELLARLTIVAEHFARSSPSDHVGSLVLKLGAADSDVAGAIVAGLAQGWPKGQRATLTEKQEQVALQLLDKLPQSNKGQLVKLATIWGSRSFARYGAEVVGALMATVQNGSQTDEVRIDAARRLIDFRSNDGEIVRGILGSITPQMPPEVAAGLAGSLAASESPAVGPEIIAGVDTMMPAAKDAALRVLLGRPQSTNVLLDALDKGQVQWSDLALDQKQALLNHPERRIARRAKMLLDRGGALPDPDRQKVLDRLMPLTQKTGDVGAGKEVFKKQCEKCHVHGNEGQRVGPDLTGMAVHPKAELLTHIVDPSRSVEGNYRMYAVITADGRVLNGLLASETKTSIELFDAEGKKQVVLREDIDELATSPKSLMPEGFEKQVQPEGIVDLLEFLTDRGRFLPIPIDKSATIVSTRGMFFNKDSQVERLVFPNWSPKMFAGVPFRLVDPNGGRAANVIMLYGPRGQFPPKMPKAVKLPCNSAAKSIHFLSGISGWGFPAIQAKSISMIVRLHYDDGEIEDHPLRNGVQFADYIRRVDVPESKLAFMLRDQQIRYFAIHPKRGADRSPNRSPNRSPDGNQDGPPKIATIELIKGPDESAPVVMAVTIESP